MGRASRTLAACALGAWTLACSSGLPRGMDENMLLVEVGGPEISGDLHRGPPMVAGRDGTARFVEPLLERFERERAFERTRFIDGFYRAPANDGFEATLARVETDLRAAGFGGRPELLLEWLEQPLAGRGDAEGRAWTPLRARLSMQTSKGERVLHAFDAPSGRDRVMLPVGTPSCDVEGPLAFSVDEVDPGELLVLSGSPRGSELRRAQERGAVAALSAYLPEFNVDPSGAERHVDAIQYRGTQGDLPLAMISRRAFDALRAAHAADPALRVAYRAEVRFDERPLRTLVATVLGEDRADEAVAIAAHVQEPGACDNASGVAGVCEAAIALADALEQGAILKPSRSVVFLFGDEFTQSSMWLDATLRRPIAGISADMLGESRERTGAAPLLERMPDPGAVTPLPPDEHTAWGGRPYPEDKLVDCGLNVIARCALLDVAALSPEWRTAEHPYEGGSDHTEFLSRGIPGVLFWHFTDFAYHTSLDRIEHVDAEELRRMSVAVLATALAVADPRPADLDRYLRTNNEERKLRVQVALDAGDTALAERWRRWSDGARQWLRVECLRIPQRELEPSTPPAVPSEESR
jgi:hypothetical protein